ncbi:MAG: lamin tail domain-containing protein, partial [Planctomycetota bacterium]
GKNDNPGPTRLHRRLTDNAEYQLLFADHVHRHFFNDGVLTPEGATALYQIRLDEVDRAVVGESARWGDNHSSTAYTRDIDWGRERAWLLNEYFPQRTAFVLDDFKGRNWYPRVDAPVFRINGLYQHGGYISPDDVLSMTATTGTIWYTIDGSDPHQSTGIEISLVTENADKRVLVPIGPVSSNWKSAMAFNDLAWLQCTGSPGGVGYEKTTGYEHLISLDLREQMHNKNATCYIRIPFALEVDPDDFSTMTFKIRYDDAFIAYINGTEVARRNFNGTPTWNSSASASHSDYVAVEFESIDISAFLGTLKQGDNLLAIHGLNTTAGGIDFLISAELIANLPSSVIEYTEPITLSHSANVKSRVLSSNIWSALNEATFAIGPVADYLRITEIMYHPQNPADPNDPNDPNEEYIELKNIGAETINLNLISFTNGIDFTFPSLELAAGQYCVLVQDRSAFEARYGSAINIAGQYSGRLNNGGERIRLEDAIGQTILEFRYRDGWRSITDGEGFSLTIIDPTNPEPNSWDEKDSWRAGAYAGGSPGQDDSGIIPNPGDIVINEILAHSHDEASDWIELYNTTGSTIDIGGWFLSDSNSNPAKYEIADGTKIGPYKYIVFREDLHFGNANAPGSHERFALSENGERLYPTITTLCRWTIIRRDPLMLIRRSAR